MFALNKLVRFDWDQWNFDKSYHKHGIAASEAEEVFLDEDKLLYEDVRHSKNEERHAVIGKIASGDTLFLSFTIRKDQIRIISARRASKKERRFYDQKA